MLPHRTWSRCRNRSRSAPGGTGANAASAFSSRSAPTSAGASTRMSNPQSKRRSRDQRLHLEPLPAQPPQMIQRRRHHRADHRGTHQIRRQFGMGQQRQQPHRVFVGRALRRRSQCARCQPICDGRHAPRTRCWCYRHQPPAAWAPSLALFGRRPGALPSNLKSGDPAKAKSLAAFPKDWGSSGLRPQRVQGRALEFL